MKIQLVSIVAPPDAVSTAQLVGEIAEDLADLGHDVSILSTQPHYNHDETAVAKQPISWSPFGLVGKSQIGPSAVEHVRMRKKANTAPGRAAQWLLFHVAAAMKLARSDAEAVLVVSPPPSLALLAPLRLFKKRRRVVLAVWELYPDILVSLGHVKPGGAMFRALRALESATYHVCGHVAFLTDGMRDTAVASHPAVATKSSVLPTWADTSYLCPQPRPTALAEELNLVGKFVVGYGGNLGPAQDLTSLVRAARLLQASHPNISFLICGEGIMSPVLRDLAADLNNVHFTGQLSFDRASEMYSTFDVSVVALADSVASEALPSKLYRSMSCGIPVLAVTTEQSALNRLIRTFAVGNSSPPDNPTELAKTVISMAEDGEHSGIGDRARQTAIDHFDRRTVTAAYARLLEEVAP